MKPPRAPRFEERRTAEFSAELQERARAWLPAWSLADEEHDFGRALLEIAARFSSEVAQRLDGAGEKMRRGFLDWLAERGEAARPARMPVVFKLADAAREGVLASAPVRMQADAGGTPVVFETEDDVRIVPGQLNVVVGVDADGDAFYLPPPGLSDLNPLEPLPAQWQVKSFAAAGAIHFQLDPEAGLLPDTIIEAEDQQYRIVSADKDLVTIDPPLVAALPKDTFVTKVTTFSPFDQKTRNQQQHALYLGDPDLLNVEAAATIEVAGASTLREGFTWQYWGKVKDKDEVSWQPLTVAGTTTATEGVVLKKSKGTIEEYEIGGKKSRWIRAYRKTVDRSSEPFTVDELSLRINAAACSEEPPCRFNDPNSSPAAEAMANTTPLVLDNVFFPLGKEPRQFDAFYLGSQEVFSKKAAKVQLCFEMADPTFFALSAVRDGQFANGVLAGVAKDRALHLLSIDNSGHVSKFREREPLQPPAPGYEGKVEPGPAVALDQPFPPPGPAEMRSHWQPPIWAEVDTQILTLTFSGFLIAVSAGDSIWAWGEHSLDRHSSGWISFGSIPATVPTATEENPVAGLVYLAGPLVETAEIVALRNGQLAKRQRADGSNWEVVPTTDSVTNNPVRLEAIVPVLDEATGFSTSIANGMVGVSDANLLYTVSNTGVCTELLPIDVDFGVRPVAVLDATGKLLISFAHTSLRDLVMFHEDHLEANMQLKEAAARVVGFETASSANGLHFFASVVVGDQGYLASWTPQTAPTPTLSQTRTPIPANLGTLGGAPTEVSKQLIVPGTRGDLFIAAFDPDKRFAHDAVVSPGIVVPLSAPTLVPNDVVMLIDGNTNTPEKRVITDYGTSREGEVFYPIDAPFSQSSTGPLLAYKESAPLPGDATAADKLQLQLNDREATEQSFVLINGSFHKITALDSAAARWLATVDPADLVVGPVNYSRPLPTAGRTAPYMRLNATNNNWPADLLKRVQLLFPGAVPEEQSAKAFSVNGSGQPIVVALAQNFTTLPPGTSPTFVVDATVGAWAQILEDTTANPELSWEYWNGKGWWKLPVTLDDTQNLKTTGPLRFDVPNDIASSDWAGKTNFWIRARLIGGDYGSKKVTVRTKTLPDGSTEQTFDPSTEGIRAPSVLKLDISYGICESLRPTFVLAQDSGTVRDQSDANRTPGAIVEAFIPLALTLGRLTKPALAPVTAKPEEHCPPDCDCQTLHPKKAESAQAVVKTPGGTRISGREVYVGLEATLSEAPVNVLLLVKETDNTRYAPMPIEALSADRFVPIVADDATRALGESGVLSMTFAIPPTRSELFGKKDLTWLRLIPKQAGENWLPTLRGAYLNAAWASATETLTRELLGSSNGGPNLTVTLARPPVLRNALELRVKEPLGDEERTELLKQDPKSVLSAVDGLPGDWVLWKQVIDPDDEPDTERVYALDETSGEIRFGDGQHGRIPPIGRDSIVAFAYARTEPDPTGGDSVPGNTIEPRTTLNLVSPVETVESVTAADQAAGGAPPESDDRVLRYGYARVRHRDRAVTAEDLEDLALQSSPDIVQVRAFVRRGYIRLVVVMRGKDPVPTAAQIRELRRLLLDAAPVSLSAPNALRIEGPRIRRLRVELELLVETLDRAGEVSASVKQKLFEFFDTGTGGIDKDGWQLGDRPSEEDIAFAISDAPHLEAIGGVRLHEITEDGNELPALEGGSPREIVMLADDPIRIQFETAEVMA